MASRGLDRCLLGNLGDEIKADALPGGGVPGGQSCQNEIQVTDHQSQNAHIFPLLRCLHGFDKKKPAAEKILTK